MSTADRMTDRPGDLDARLLLRRHNGNVLTLTLNRPLARNSLSRQLIDELRSALDARRAAEIGLVNRVVANDLMDDEIGRLAGIIASKSPLTVTTGKQAFYRQAEMQLAEAYDYTSRVMVENMLRRDSKEGMAAFLEKRPPDWKSDGTA